MRARLRQTGIAAVLAVAVATATACGDGSSARPSASTLQRPSSTGTIMIVSPTDGEVFDGSDVHVKVELRGARVVPATTTDIVPDQGHLHLTLDGQVVTMNFSTSETLHDVTPGIHTLQVEFVATDHLPFDPRVLEQVTFQVKA